MELVYLWVEECKNIVKKGFNFSPQFNCKYDDKAKKLTINKNDDCIENFFDDNINVTAIVGKNGSGKSNVLKSLFQNKDNNSSKESLWYVLNISGKLNIYFIDNKGIFEHIDIKFKNNIDDLRKNSISIKQDLKFSMIFFSNILQYLPLHDDQQNKSFYNISISYLINRYSKELKNKKFIDFKYQYNYYKSKMIESTLLMLKDTDFKIDFELPQELNIVTKNSFDSDKDNKMNQILTQKEPLSFQLHVKKNIIYNYLNNGELQEELKQEKRTIDEFYEDIKSKIPLQDELDNLLNLLDNPDFFMTSIKIKNLDGDFIEALKKFHKIQALSLGVLDIFHFNWKPELSSGQENLLFQFASFYNVLKNSNNLENDIIIFLDEGETTMHPNWQKVYIKLYLSFLSKNFKDKKFHIVFTTHSPFLLSDIPKQNIIFLDTDENRNCKVVKDGLKEKKETFGANIHTLLSDSFFMEGGLMGEFAKNKIQEILDFLNDEKSIDEITTKEDDIKKVIEAIGEPFLKEKLLQMYYQKFKDKASKKARKDELIAKQKWIEEELKRL